MQYTIFSTYLVSTHEMPGVPSSSCDKQKCLQTLPNVPERENHTEHYRSKLGLLLKAIPSHQAIFLYFCSYEPPVLEVTSPTLLLTYDPSSKTTSTSKKTTWISQKWFFGPVMHFPDHCSSHSSGYLIVPNSSYLTHLHYLPGPIRICCDTYTLILSINHSSMKLPG